MKERVLFQKLQTLSAKELKRFWEYLSSSTSNQQLLNLAAYLKKHFLSAAFDEKAMAVSIYGKKKIDEKTLSRLLNNANNIFDKFAMAELSDKSEWEKQMDDNLNLLDFYQNRLLLKFTSKLSTKIEDQFAERTVQDEAYFKYKMLYYLRPRMADHQNPEARAKQRKQKTQVLDEFYFFIKLYDEALELAHHQSFKTESASIFIDKIVKHIKENAYSESSSINLLSRAVDLLSNPDDEDLFRELETELFRTHNKQNIGLTRDLFTILLNTYLKQESDKMKISKKALEYFLFQIENEIIFENGFFPSLVFENIVSTGLKTKGSDWVRDFVNEYGHRVHPESRKGSINFARAKCHFFDGKPNDCLLELAKIKRSRFKNVFLNIVVRVLKIKALYEIDHTDSEYDRNQPEREINTFRKYVVSKQEELSDHYLMRFKNFANTLMRMSVCNSEKKAQSLVEEVSDASFVVEDKTWLIAKTKELF